MRKGLLLATMALSAGMGLSPLGAASARAQVVSPLGGSTGTPQSAPPATRVPAPSAAPAAAAAAPAAPAPASAPAAAHPPRRSFNERFQAANTTHDGKLTLEQARAGRLRSVVRDFDQIDTAKRGYVTLDEVKAHQAARRAAARASHGTKPAPQ